MSCPRKPIHKPKPKAIKNPKNSPKAIKNPKNSSTTKKTKNNKNMLNFTNKYSYYFLK